MSQTTKDWDAHVVHAEEIARSDGFKALRDQIVALARPDAEDVVVDVGSGTGLLALAIAPVAATVWAVDVAPAMTDYLTAKAASAGLENIRTVTASAVSLPLVDGMADVVVSNYCLHHLDNGGKDQALAEAFRVLRPGGTFVFGDMMFSVSVTAARDRRVIASKVRIMLRRGPAGVWRLARNAGRLLTGRWESPAPAAWWQHALERAGFTDVRITELAHEGGIAIAMRPMAEPISDEPSEQLRADGVFS